MRIERQLKSPIGGMCGNAKRTAVPSQIRVRADSEYGIGPQADSLMAAVLNCLPKSAHPGAMAALAEIWNAEDKDHATAAARAFAAQYGAKWPKATAKITDDLDVLLEFNSHPAEHWVHLCTTNKIESTFATVRLRQRVTKGPVSRAAGIAMAFKLIESAQARWRAVNAPHLVALLRAEATFDKGILIERPEDTNPKSGGDQQVA